MPQNKWFATIKTNWNQYLAYKLDFLSTAIIPAILFLAIKYNLFSVIYQSNSKQIIAGFTLEMMLSYQCWILIFSLLTSSYSERSLAEDIRLGRISSYLIYPFSFWKFHFASFLAFSILQLVISFFSIIVFALLGMIQIEPIGLILFLSVSIFVSILWFFLRFALGLIAFWLEETWTFRIILVTLVNLLSGAIFPIDMFPSAIQKILYLTPFPFMTYFPVKIGMGLATNTEIINCFIAVISWSLLSLLFCNFLWRRGLKLYTASGM